jgi:hypothetical protein
MSEKLKAKEILVVDSEEFKKLVRRYKELSMKVKEMEKEKYDIRKKIIEDLKARNVDKVLVFTVEGETLKKITVSYIKTLKEYVALSKVNDELKQKLRVLGVIEEKEVEYVQIR